MCMRCILLYSLRNWRGEGGEREGVRRKNSSLIRRKILMSFEELKTRLSGREGGEGNISCLAKCSFKLGNGICGVPPIGNGEG